MRVLQFAPRVCWPLDTGAKLRNYHLARVLSKRARVTLVAFADGNPSSVLEKLYDQVVTVSRSAGYTPAKILRGALGRTPLTVLNYTTDEMMQALKRLLAERDFDIVQVESVHLAAYLPVIRAARYRPLIVCDWHNIESELMQRYADRERSSLRKAYAQKTARQLAALELKASQQFDAHVFVSERDMARIQQFARNANSSVIENGVDTDYYSDEQIKQAHAAWTVHHDQDQSRRRIVFVGSMDYHANIDAVVNFAHEVWPELHRRKPELRFTIVGRDPAPEIRELSAIPGIDRTGTVDDVRPYYHDALAAIVPLRVGGGSRLKILEAMAAGVPVVSTTLGAEGLAVQDGENILLTDTNEALREAIVSVAENNGLRTQLVACGRTLVSNRYDWSTLGTSLFRVYDELLNGKSPSGNSR